MNKLDLTKVLLEWNSFLWKGLTLFIKLYPKKCSRYFKINNTLDLNAVLVSGVQQSHSVINAYTFFFPWWFISGYWIQFLGLYRSRSYGLSISYIIACICSFQTHNLSLPHALFPLVTISLFSVSLFLFCKLISLYYFLDSTYKWYHKILVFLCMTSLRVIFSRFVYVAAVTVSFFFMAQ